MNKKLCIHLNDGTVLFVEVVHETKTDFTVVNPLVLTKFFEPSGNMKLLLAQYDNFGECASEVTLYKSGIMSSYPLDVTSIKYYDDYVSKYDILDTQVDTTPEDIVWPESPKVPQDAVTMHTIMREGVKKIDTNELRKNVIRLVHSRDDDDKIE